MMHACMHTQHRLDAALSGVCSGVLVFCAAACVGMVGMHCRRAGVLRSCRGTTVSMYLCVCVCVFCAGVVS